MFRRTFLKSIGASALFASLPSSFKLHAGNVSNDGKLLISIQVGGGWDVTSFCDPKLNTAGEPDINNWANSAEIQQVGNIKYAPVANNQSFFEKYYQDMLVINGVDAQTNSHTTGITHNWSGRMADGFPTITALFASIHAPTLPMTYINNGGYNRTGGLTRFTRLQDSKSLLDIISPNRVDWDPDVKFFEPSDWSNIQTLRNSRFNKLKSNNTYTAKQIKAVTDYQSAIENSSTLANFANRLESEGNIPESTTLSSLKKQAYLALNAMYSNVSVSADLLIEGFDTHDKHDELHTPLLGELTDGIDYLWEYAEQIGIADKLVVIIGSDFSRTPYYNSENGKDHWPIGSYIIMERNVSWTNRTVGLTDFMHNVVPISPNDFSESNNGEIIYPKHVMQNLRQYLGLNGHDNVNSFQFNDASSFDFFSV